MMGGKRDLAARETMQRSDDHAQRFDIATARDHIYKKNLNVKSAAVERILFEKSLVPTRVRVTGSTTQKSTKNHFRTRFQQGLQT